MSKLGVSFHDTPSLRGDIENNSSYVATSVVNTYDTKGQTLQQPKDNYKETEGHPLATIGHMLADQLLKSLLN